MKMSIDDAIETLKDTNSYGTADIAKMVAIDTMRKYQIIVNDLKACEQDGMEFISVGFLKEIIDGDVD